MPRRSERPVVPLEQMFCSSNPGIVLVLPVRMPPPIHGYDGFSVWNKCFVPVTPVLFQFGWHHPSMDMTGSQITHQKGTGTKPGLLEQNICSTGTTPGLPFERLVLKPRAFRTNRSKLTPVLFQWNKCFVPVTPVLFQYLSDV